MNRVLLTKNLANNCQLCKSTVLSQQILALRENYPQHKCDQVRRCVTNSAARTTDINTFPNKLLYPKFDWNRAVIEAERVVGNPKSLLKIRLHDELGNITTYLRKLAGSSHPLQKTINYLLHNDTNSVHVWGLIVLLISKTAGHDPTSAIEQESAGVLHSQRALAEITKMMRTIHLIHSSIVNLQKTSKAGQDTATYDDMVFGNKFGLLIGDYLLAESKVELGKLRNQDVFALIVSTGRDFSESEFIGDRDEQNNPLPTKTEPQSARLSETSVIKFDDIDMLVPLNTDKAMGNAEKEWEVRNILNGGSLLGKSCKATMKLAMETDDLEKSAYLFGKHLHLAWQACLDAKPFQSSSLPLDTSISLVSAPVLFHLEHDPSLYDVIEKGKVYVEQIDYINIHKQVLQGPGLEKTKQLQRYHTAAAIRALKNFPSNDARTILENIVLGFRD